MSDKRGVLIDNLNDFWEYITDPKNKSLYVTVWSRLHPTSFFYSWRIKTVSEWVRAKRFYTKKEQK